MTTESPPARRDASPPAPAGDAGTERPEHPEHPEREGGSTPGASSAPGGAEAPEVRRGRLLIIDDEVVFSGSLRRLFSNEHDVTVINRGRDALDQLRGGQRYDAILCDLVMPEITGIELHAELQRFAPDQAECMVFLTGGAFSEKSQQFLDGIGNRWFEKPCNLEQLRAAVREVVVRHRGR